MKINFPRQEKVSFSRIKLWRRCQMAHHYKYVQKLSKKKKALPLFVGSAIHLMIEYYLEFGDWSVPYNEFKQEFNTLFREERLELGDIPELVKTIVTGYLSYYADDGLIYLKRRNNRATELRVKVDISNEIRFDGYVDAYPVDEMGRNWLMDHKSCKFIPSEEARFSDYQLLIYSWLLPQLGYPEPDGVIWDYLRTKAPAIPEVLKNGQISKSQKIDTTFEVYKDTVIKQLGYNKWKSDYMEFAKKTFTGKEDKFYKRVRLPTPPQELINHVVEDLLKTGKDIYIHGHTATVRNLTKDCSWCQFYNLCHAEIRGLDSAFIKAKEFDCGVKDEEDSEEHLEI